MIDRMRAVRRPGESYSEVILRLAIGRGSAQLLRFVLIPASLSCMSASAQPSLRGTSAKISCRVRRILGVCRASRQGV